MIKDEAWRIAKIGDALSQLANVTLLPGHINTTANESISGRSYRMGWRLQIVIDALFFWEGPGHCRRAHLSDIERARALLKAEDQKNA